LREKHHKKIFFLAYIKMPQPNTFKGGIIAGALAGLLTVTAIWLCFRDDVNPDDTDETTNWHKKCYKSLPLVALFIGLFALMFQVTVLHPWHMELSDHLQSISNKF
jgi:hypothetical protein